MFTLKTINDDKSLKKIGKYSLLLVFMLFCIQLAAQDYKLLSYSSKQGLHSNLTKAMIQDNFGFIWIATDNGLERFNGREFELFINELPSPYVKSLYLLANGNLLAVTDMGVVEIVCNPDKPEFNVLARGSTNHTDSLLFYPKLIFKDSKENYWVADNNSIWLLDNGNLKKFAFPEKCFTLNFQRSFAIVENKQGELYAFSETGYAYKYNRENDKFIEQNGIAKLPSVDGAIFIDDSRLLIASYDGLFLLNINAKDAEKATRILQTDACAIEPLNDSVLFVASWNNGVHKCLIRDKVIEIEKVESITDVKINNLLIDKKENLWLSSDLGVVLAQNLSFNSLSQLINMTFVKSIEIASNNKVYCIADNAYSFVKENNKMVSHLLYSLKSEGNLMQIAASKTDPSLLYLSTTNAQLIVLKNYEVIRQIDLSAYGRVLFYLVSDYKGNLWACLDGCKGVVKVSSDFNVEEIGEERGLDSRAIVVSCDSNDNLFCGGIGDSTYLFKYDYLTGTFKNESIVLPFDHSNEIVINDIAIRNNTVYLASSEGVVKKTEMNLERIDLGAFTNKSIASIAIDRKGFVWFSNDVGLFKYKDGKYYVFRENDGLNTIVGSYRCLAIDSSNQVWFGTQSGLNYSSGIKEVRETAKPILTKILLDGRAVSTQINRLEIKKHSYIQFDYISLELPGGDVVYKTKIDGFDEDWSVDKYENKILLPSLPLGEYTLNIKARQHGNYNWSEALVYSFSVVPSWYQTWWAFLLYVMALVFLIGVANVLYSRRLIDQKKILEHKVKIRTEEILKKNEQLEYLNNTKDKFFGIIAHDLRNPFSSILGLSKILSADFNQIDDEKKYELINLIHSSTEKTYILLENLLTWARSQTNTIYFKPVSTSIGDLITDTVNLLEPTIVSKNIKISYSFNDDLEVDIDRDMITTVVRNLIMNAIKYSYRNKAINIKVEKDAVFAKISISDQGVGIKPQRVQELFKINEKISEPGTENEKGTGLGLILCKEFVEKHKGEIGVVSQLDNGSTFWFTIPLFKM